MIYLDYNASTPVDATVREAMLPYLERYYGNPTSAHALGKHERHAIETARAQVAAFLGASPGEIVFTSGGTESNNHVIKGVAFSLRDRGNHLIVSKVEHPSVLNPCRFLERQKFEVTYVDVDSTGRVDSRSIAEEIRPTTVLISVMHANNEVGTVQPIAEIAEIAKEAGVWLHTDAAQSCGKIETRVDRLGVDFLTLAGHKVYAPQGIGALYIREGRKIEPLNHGAGHQGGRRSGTEPVAAIVGLGAAAELASQRTSDEARMRILRDRLHHAFQRDLGDAAVRLGHPTLSLPNTLSIGFRGRKAADLLAACPDLCASPGAACHSGKHEPSPVLAAMNVPSDVALGAIRFSVGRSTTEHEIDTAAKTVIAAVAAERAS